MEKIDNVNQPELNEDGADNHVFYNTRSKKKSPPKNYNDKMWADYLERTLTGDEKNLLRDCRAERNINKSLVQLSRIIKNKNIGIGCLTGLYGNCLFESLKYYGICDDIKKFRITLAHIMFKFKNVKNFFFNQEETLEELFDISNVDDIGNVMGSDNKIYKYTYDVMLLDLTNNYSWTRLPTHLIIMVISKIYNIRINIYSNETTHVNIINMGIGDPIDIYLGHLDNSHYIALRQTDNINNEKQLSFHVEANKKFCEWKDALLETINNPINDTVDE